MEGQDLEVLVYPTGRGLSLRIFDGETAVSVKPFKMDTRSKSVYCPVFCWPLMIDDESCRVILDMGQYFCKEMLRRCWAMSSGGVMIQWCGLVGFGSGFNRYVVPFNARLPHLTELYIAQQLLFLSVSIGER